MKKKRNSILITDVVLTLPALLGYSLLVVVPILMGFWYSLTDWNGISRSLNFIGFQNYIELFTDRRFLRVIGFTFRYAAYLVVGILIVSSVIALILHAKPKGWTFFKTVFFLPCLFSLVTMGLLFREVFSKALPIVGEVLGSDVLSKSLLSNSKYAIFAVLYTNVWSAIAIPTVLLFATLKSIPKDLYEVADIDGGNYWNKFRHITLPYLIPTLNMVFVTSLKGGLGVFEYVMVLTQGGPGRATESLAYLIYNKGFNESSYAYASSMSFFMFLVMAVISLSYFRIFKRKEVDA